MSLFFRQTAVVIAKEFQTEFREASHLVSVLLFGILLLILFSFALSTDPDLMRRMAPGLFWLAVFFTSILTLEYSFRRETTDGQWDGLLLLGTDPKALYLGKMLANLSLIVLMEVALLPSMTILFDLPFTAKLAVVLFLGSLGIATVGTFYAGLTATFEQGRVLLPLLLFPMLVPVLLASVNATQLILVHDVFDQKIAWLKLLLAFDTIFLIGSLLLADSLFEGTS